MIVDHYFVNFDQLGDTVDELDSRLLAGQANTGTLARIHTLKMTLLALRRALWLLREAVMTLQHGDSGLLDPKTRLYLRDVYDHLVHLLETVDLQRDLVAGMVDLYVSTQSNLAEPANALSDGDCHPVHAADVYFQHLRHEL